MRLTADLVSNAHRLRAALLAGDLPAVGACLSTYWTQKKAMAGTHATQKRKLPALRVDGWLALIVFTPFPGGAEPAEVTAMIECVRDCIYGCALGGAGGGGASLLAAVHYRPGAHFLLFPLVPQAF